MLLIGSTAIVNDLVMVTENIKEFERISGIEIENGEYNYWFIGSGGLANKTRTKS